MKLKTVFGQLRSEHVLSETVWQWVLRKTIAEGPRYDEEVMPEVRSRGKHATPKGSTHSAAGCSRHHGSGKKEN